MISYSYIVDGDIFAIQKGNKIIYYHDYTNAISYDIEKVLEQVPKNIHNIQESRVRRIVILPSNTCNLSCTYCFSQKDRANAEMLQFETIEKTLDSMVAEDAISEFRIVFTGSGEPTTNFNLIKNALENLIR